jgi:hypothetical protein
MFYRLNIIVNELRSLEHKIDEDFSHKFLRCLPKKFKIIVTTILRGGLKDLTPTSVGRNHHS